MTKMKRNSHRSLTTKPNPLSLPRPRAENSFDEYIIYDENCEYNIDF